MENSRFHSSSEANPYFIWSLWSSPPTRSYATLYEFWGEKITDLINSDLKKSGSNFIVNLASNEYFSSVKKKSLAGDLITPVFKDEKNGKYKIIAFYAKKARGMMADYIVRNNITDVAGLKKFKTSGYKFSKADSTDDQLVFMREEQKK